MEKVHDAKAAQKTPPQPQIPRECTLARDFPDFAPFDPAIPVGTDVSLYYHDKRDQMRQLQPFVLDSLPFFDNLRMMFNDCINTHNDDMPNQEAVNLCVQQFHALPAEHRRMILKGWDVPLHILGTTRDDIDQGQKYDVLIPVLEFTLKSHGECWGQFAHTFTEHHERIHVFVQLRIGTEKMEAVSTLRDIANQLERHWETMHVNGEKTGVYSEK